MEKFLVTRSEFFILESKDPNYLDLGFIYILGEVGYHDFLSDCVGSGCWSGGGGGNSGRYSCGTGASSGGRSSPKDLCASATTTASTAANTPGLGTGRDDLDGAKK
jgi:hypothetical protein